MKSLRFAASSDFKRGKPQVSINERDSFERRTKSKRQEARPLEFAVLASFVISAVITSSGDLVNQTMLAAPIIVLYLLGVAVAWLFGTRPQTDGKGLVVAAMALLLTTNIPSRSSGDTPILHTGSSVPLRLLQATRHDEPPNNTYLDSSVKWEVVVRGLTKPLLRGITDEATRAASAPAAC